MKYYHYTYEIIYPSGKRYIGMRSSSVPPEEDTSYMGSSRVIPKEETNGAIKFILGNHSTRLEALEEEVRLHRLHDVRHNDQFYNLVNSAFNSTGFMGPKADKHIHFKPWFFVAPQGEYVEVNDIAVRNYKDANTNFPFTARQLVHRMNKDNRNKAGKRNPFKGWIFGFLEDKPKIINQQNLDFIKELAQYIDVSQFNDLHLPSYSEEKTIVKRCKKTGKILPKETDED